MVVGCVCGYGGDSGGGDNGSRMDQCQRQK